MGLRSRFPRRLAIGIATGGLLATASPLAFAVTMTPVLDGLDGPRGVTVGPAGRVLVAEADGTVSQLTTRGRHAGHVTTLFSVPPSYIAPTVAMNGRGETFALVAGSGQLYRWTPGGGLHQIADIAAYQETDPDPYNLADPPEESNAFGLDSLPDGSVLVSDAAANDLLRVSPDGTIVTVARLKPRVVTIPDGLPGAGGTMPAEAVATSVTVGADGAYYVGELRGYPATPGTSEVWRIAPGSQDALCDPESPDTGACQRYADGFTSIVDLAAGKDGSVYVVELAKDSWLAFEGGGSTTGGLFRIPPGGGSPTELAADQLTLPGGADVGKAGLYLTMPVFGDGMLVLLN